MMRRWRRIAVAAATALALSLGSHLALAQKSGGVLKIPDFASPASMSIHEEVTRAAVTVLTPVFNNLVLFDQHKEKNTLDTIVPDLAESWTWSEDGKELTFKLRHGVNWRDGKPFTAAHVKCTWDLPAREKLRLNPRKAWYRNLDEVTTTGDDEITFHLKRPQTLSARAAGLRHIAGLSLPCLASADAPAPDRNRSIQVHRLQAGRIRQADPQPGLLEAWAALSRRARIPNRCQCRHPQPDGCGRRYRW